MPDIALVLGPIVFQDFEVPARINIGGAQRVAVHRMIGGARVVDSLGRDDSELRFEGVFSGQDATLRARTLDQLRAAGAPLPVTWDVFYYTAILTRFEADYRNAWWIPFRVVCTVVRDETAVSLDVVLSLSDSALSDVSQAITWMAGTDLGLAAARAALSAPSAAVRGTADYAGAQGSLAAVQSAFSQTMSSTEVTLNSTNLGSASSASDTIATLGTAVLSSQQLAGLAIANGYVGRAASNLANAST
ncbi:MAG: hypothetical protein WBQ75_04615 [Acetobacteraceae bacterium]